MPTPSKPRKAAFDVSVDFCGVLADTPEEAKARVEKTLRQALSGYKEADLTAPLWPWLVTVAQKLV